MRWLISFALLAACSSNSSAPPVDAAIDSMVDPCLTCALGQVCVALYDGNCLLNVRCVAKTVECPLNACSTDCQAAYCSPPYQCMIRPTCGGESSKAFTCYGP